MNLNDLEQERKKVLLKTNVSRVVFSLIGIGIIIFFITIYNGPFGERGSFENYVKNLEFIRFCLYLFVINSILFMVYIANVLHIQYDYKKNYKREIIKPLIEEEFQNMKYEMDNYMKYEEFIKSCLFPQSEENNRTVAGEDYIYGKINDCNFKMSEMRYTTYENRQGNSKRIIILFSGLFLKLEVNKDFESKTVIRRKISVPLDKNTQRDEEEYISNLKLSKIDIENKEFNDIFHIYSSDKTKSLKILNKETVDIILKMQKKFRNLKVSFIDNKIYMSISEELELDDNMNLKKNNFFEPKLNVSVFDKNQLEEHIFIIEELKSFINSIS